MITNCKDENCALCFTNYTCITCKYHYTINSNEKICFKNQIERTDTSSIADHNQNFGIEEILKKEFKNLTSKQIGEIFHELKFNITDDTNEIIEIENIVFELSTYEEQKKYNPNVSSIDLGECEQSLKDKEKLSNENNLIVIKWI